jgi:hypothetical protein
MPTISVGTITVAALSAASIVSAGDILTITGTTFPYRGVEAYVQTDLVAHYDGIYNDGINKSHNNTSTTWKDLSDSHNDTTISNTAGVSGWTCNGFKFPTGVYFKRDNPLTNIPVGDTNYSIEFVYDPKNADNLKVGGFLGWGNDSYGNANKIRFNDIPNGGSNRYFSHYWYGGAHDFNFEIPSGTGVRQMSITYNNTSGRRAYAEGAVFSTHTSKGKNTTSSNPLYLGYTGHNHNTYGQEYANGNLIHSIRIYKRALDQNEIQWNYEVDKIRFMVSPPVVKIGNEECKCLTIISATEMRCTLPPNSGVQNVTVSYGGDNNIKVGEVSYKSIWLDGEKPKWLFIDGQQVKAAWYDGSRVF